MLALFDQQQDLVEFFDIGQHGDHHVDLAVCRGSQDRTHLRDEQLRFFQAATYRAQTHRRVVCHRALFRRVLQFLVSTQIGSTDGEWLALQACDTALVEFELHLLAGPFVLLDEQHLGTEQADTGVVIFFYVADVIRGVDIRLQGDGFVIQRDAGLVFKFLEFGLAFALIAYQFAEMRQRGLVGIDMDDTVITVDDELVTGFDMLLRIMYADDSRDAEVARKDGGVRQWATELGDETGNIIMTDDECVGWRKIVGYDDTF